LKVGKKGFDEAAIVKCIVLYTTDQTPLSDLFVRAVNLFKFLTGLQCQNYNLFIQMMRTTGW